MGLDVTGPYRYPPPDTDWLVKATEAVIEPDLPIIDAHHHLWVEGGNSYLKNELLGDLAAGHNVAATVLVQAGYGYREDGPEHLRCVGETEKVSAMAAQIGEEVCGLRACEGIVAFADLTLDEAKLAEVLDAHERQSGGRLRGIRHSVSHDTNFPDGIVLRPAPRHMLADPAYRTGMAMLARRGLSYDAMLYHQQIGELTEAARALPDLAIILDHYGTPLGVGPYEGCEEERFRQWSADMAELATCPNVCVKLGGLGMIITGAKWHERDLPPHSRELAEAWRPWFDRTLDLFGPDRCMFESNFPVDKAMYSYVALWNAFKRLSQDFGQDERAALFHDTAARVYRLGPQG